MDIEIFRPNTLNPMAINYVTGSGEEPIKKKNTNLVPTISKTIQTQIRRKGRSKHQLCGSSNLLQKMSLKNYDAQLSHKFNSGD